MGLVFQFFANLPFGWVLNICYVTVGFHVPQTDIGLAYGLIVQRRWVAGSGNIYNFMRTGWRGSTIITENTKVFEED